MKKILGVFVIVYAIFVLNGILLCSGSPLDALQGTELIRTLLFPIPVALIAAAIAGVVLKIIGKRR